MKSKHIQFHNSTTIQVEEGEFPDHDHLYCRLFWVGGAIQTYTIDTLYFC